MITTKVKLKPFNVPSYVLQETRTVLRQSGFSETPKIHLSDLSEEELTALCDKFKADVFAKAKAGDKD